MHTSNVLSSILAPDPWYVERMYWGKSQGCIREPRKSRGQVHSDAWHAASNSAIFTYESKLVYESNFIYESNFHDEICHFK